MFKSVKPKHIRHLFTMSIRITGEDKDTSGRRVVIQNKGHKYNKRFCVGGSAGWGLGWGTCYLRIL